jgi:ABC-type branched-subunit amino acid transport system permease subunit
MAHYFRITFGVVVIIYLGCWFLTKLPFGKALLAIRDSEDRALSLGYNTKMVKTIVFGISACLAGLGGGLYAVLTGFVSPPLLGFAPSFDAVVWMMVGGMGTLYGPVIGTIGVNITKFYLSGILLHYWLLVIGFLFVVIVIFFPDGCAGIIHRVFKRRT